MSLPFISPLQPPQNHFSTIMHYPSTTKPYGTCPTKKNTMVFITRQKPGPTSVKKNTRSSRQLFVIPYQQSPSPPLRPTPTVSLNGTNTAYVFLVTLNPPTGHAAKYFLRSFPSLNYAYSSPSLFRKYAKWRQDILNRHFVKHIFLMVRHMCYAPLNIVPLPPQTRISSSYKTCMAWREARATGMKSRGPPSLPSDPKKNTPCIFSVSIMPGHPPIYVGPYVGDFIYFSASRHTVIRKSCLYHWSLLYNPAKITEVPSYNTRQQQSHMVHVIWRRRIWSS